MLPLPAPVVVVRDNMGGLIDAFANRVLDYRDQRVLVRIEGECASACTMLAGLPRAHVCVGPEAALEFHQAFIPRDPGHLDASDVYRRSEPGVRLLMRFYPPRIKAWIRSHGGLTARLIVLRGRDLTRMFKPCEAA